MNKKPVDYKSGCIWPLFVLITGLVVNPIVAAFVGVRVWAWFIEPLTHYQISMAQFYGLASVVSLLRHPTTTRATPEDKKDLEERPWSTLIGKLIGTWAGAGVLWLACYLVHRWFQ